MKTNAIKGLSAGVLLLLVAPSVLRCEGYMEDEDVSSECCYDTPALAKGSNMHLNKRARQFVKNYIGENRKNLNRIRQISQHPFAVTDSIFKVYKLPAELKYLEVIESELKAKAVSRVGAAGPWQLMPQTAQILGLKTGYAHDERKQYLKSTRAAAIYLRDLYSEFGDWLLVLAAYNGGPAPVYKAIHKSGSRNFWKLQFFLPAESRDHVKKFIATLHYFEAHENAASADLQGIAARQ
jgi:membrane-bound lytic murein transglycosylase D